MVKTGRYRHYKGKDYEVIGCARHSETEEEYVVYRALYEDRGLWVRPTALFMQPVTVEGRVMARFAPLFEEGARLTGKESVPAGSAREDGPSTGKDTSWRVGGGRVKEPAGGRAGEMAGDTGKESVSAGSGRAGEMTPGAGGCDHEGAQDER